MMRLKTCVEQCKSYILDLNTAERTGVLTFSASRHVRECVGNIDSCGFGV